MGFAKTSTISQLRTLLVLGRVSNVPTVWSNCLAGWLLGGAGTGPVEFLCLCAGATCLYIGGMFLNDAFDEAFDRQHRKERPIPSGAIRSEQVWLWGFAWLIGGAIFLTLLGMTTGLLAMFLIAAIILYDAIHKIITFSPVLMANCRFLLYLVAASAGGGGVAGLAIWSGFALAAYIIGLSYLARKESVRGPLRYWPCYLLAVPICLALLVNDGEYRTRGIVLSLILIIWLIRCLRFTFGGADRNIGLTVSGLLAGIVLVDLLAVADATPLLICVFVVLFVMALLFQRFIPAT
ncbi:MAG: UbiA family prenyltransferase [Verrucomicrobia bacterium]|nr:UbiA family prenyltransferase [Verrucomicrobiota bacterium]